MRAWLSNASKEEAALLPSPVKKAADPALKPKIPLRTKNFRLRRWSALMGRRVKEANQSLLSKRLWRKRNLKVVTIALEISVCLHPKIFRNQFKKNHGNRTSNWEVTITKTLKWAWRKKRTVNSLSKHLVKITMRILLIVKRICYLDLKTSNTPQSVGSMKTLAIVSRGLCLR